MDDTISVPPPSSATPSFSAELLAALSANAQQMEALRSSTIFMTPVITLNEEGTAVIAAEEESGGSALEAENAALRAELAEARSHGDKIAEAQRRQSEMQATLLRAAHAEALEARDEARADALSLRDSLAQTQAEVQDARDRLEQQQQVRDTEVALEAALAAQRRRGDDRSVTGARLLAIRGELAAEAASSSAVALAEPDTAAQLGSLLGELRDWAGQPSVEAAAADSPGARARREAVLGRLGRLEGMIEAATERFEQLQSENEDLRLRCRRLKARRRTKGAAGEPVP